MQYRIVVEKHDSAILRWRWSLQWKVANDWRSDEDGFAITRRIGLMWAKHRYRRMQRIERKHGSFIAYQAKTRLEVDLAGKGSSPLSAPARNDR